MGHPTTVIPLGKRLLPLVVSITLLLPLLFAVTAPAADLSLSSKTYLRYYERELAGDEDTLAPLYEYLSVDATNLGGMPVAFHFYGWGRVDLADPSTSDNKQAWDLGSAYLEYLHPQGNAQMKLGRFFLTEGAAMETLDGAFVKATTPLGLGVSVYGGAPVEYSILNGTKGGSALYGGRVFFVQAGYVEIGASYLRENGTFQEGEDRELYGGDLWLRVAPPVELTAQATYNRSVREMASQRYAVRIVPGATFDVSAGYESYTYKGLFQSTLNPAFVFPSVDNNDKVQTIFGIVDWAFVPGWTLEVAAKNIRHDKSDPGNANRGEAGLRYTYNEKKDVAGIAAAFLAADRDENEYREFRGFATYSPSKIRLALDALTQQYKQEIFGKKNAYQVVASAGYQVLAALQLSGDLMYTQSPTYRKDYAGLLRATVELGTSTGGKK
jgi:hypothetical protein